MKKTLFLLFLIGQMAVFAQGPREKVKFDFDWKFALGDIYHAKDAAFDDAQWRTLNVPHDWSVEGEFEAKNASCTGYLPGGIGWYRKSFDVPESYRGKTVSIQFDGVYNNSEVWINGHYLGVRPYGYISFHYNLTPYLQIGKKNVISVRVDHSKFADTRWYSGSGIYRHVWLNVTQGVHVAQWGTYITTTQVSAASAQVNVKTTVAKESKSSAKVKVISTIFTQLGKEVAKTESDIQLNDSLSYVNQSLTVTKPELWDIEKPALYTMKTKITDGQTILDEYETRFGIRTLEFNPNEGLLLNGKSVKMKGVCLHHDGGCVGAAVPEKIWRLRLEKLKAGGCNAIRTSHNPVAPEFLDLCDELGFVVMDEAFDEWEYAKRKWINGWNKTISGKEGYSEHFRQWAHQDLRDMIERDKNHASVIMWSIGNEIDYANDPYADMQSSQGQVHQEYSVYRPAAQRMVEIAQGLIKVIKEIDPSRPVTMALANMGNSRRIGLPEILDVVGYNYTESRYDADHQNFPNQFLYGSENPHNYDGWLAVKNKKFISAQFLWTGIDYLGEANPFPFRSAYSGLLDLTGSEKSIFYWRQSMWSDKPMLFATARKKRVDDKPTVDPMAKLAWFVSEIEEKQHWNYQAGDTILVMAYTNCAEAELFLNGKSMGKKISNPANSSLWWYVPYQAGEVKVVSKLAKGQVLQSFLKTVSEPVSVSILADAKTIKADGQDVAVVEVKLMDKNGNFANTAANRVDFEVSGEGKVISTDNGDAACTDNFKLSWRKAYQGRCIAVIQSAGNKGKIKITAKVAGLPEVSVEISAE
jgi:beta-galactosidase